ncbi:hypothetical protein [Pseudomonas sp. B329]|uniref:hypothetical protein n=1 Tax=Pseudomonas sp. B329 TaxID=1553459 RepID=UPI0020048F09|nr:hypothetical protein [Pseudomonas sp. B329]MCK3861659.1 hypothetical protein [Pseudomonas sp. B329]
MIKLTNMVMCIVALIFSTNSSALDVSMKTEDIQSLNLSVKIPREFTLLPEDLAEIKYAGKKRPQVIYANESGSVSFGISKLKKPEFVKVDEIKDEMMNAMRNLTPQASPAIVDGYKAWRITFISKGLDVDILNMQIYMVTDKNLIIAAFNMAAGDIESYKVYGEKTLASIKFK